MASWDLNVDRTVQDPFQNAIFDRFERPVPKSKYIVRVVSKDLNWRNFLYFS